LAVSTLLLLLGAASPARAEVPLESGLRPAARAPKRVVVLRRPGCRAYERTVEEYRGRVRAIVRVLPVVKKYRGNLLDWLGRYRPQLIFTVGQSAYDHLRGAELGQARLLHALVYHDVSAKHLAIPTRVPTGRVLAAFRALDPSLKNLALLHGPGTATEARRTVQEARTVGIRLVRLQASTPAQAISMLRRLGEKTQGLWLFTDLRILTAQVVQYALGLQFRRRLPLMGATRRHVKQGALLALDYAPHVIGRRAAALTNQILTGPRRRRLRQKLPPLRPRLTLNRGTARALGLQITALARSQQAEVLP
jgi:hypothetical protein